MIHPSTTSTDGSIASTFHRLARIHDWITQAGFVCGTAFLVVIVLSYCFEVVSRYFFSSPTTWVSSLVSYLLCYVVFLAMPELARQRIHIFISIVLDSLSPGKASFLQYLAHGIAAFACFGAAFFCFEATWTQYVREIATINEWPLPKWLISIVIPYGFFSTGLYYARLSLGRAPYQSSETV